VLRIVILRYFNFTNQGIKTLRGILIVKCNIDWAIHGTLPLTTYASIFRGGR